MKPEKIYKISRRNFYLIFVLAVLGIFGWSQFYRFMCRLFDHSVDDFWIVVAVLGFALTLTIFWLVCEARKSENCEDYDKKE